MNRRTFFKTSAAAGMLGAAARPAFAQSGKSAFIMELERAAAEPVLRRELFPDPVIIESLELLKNGDYYFVRIRSKDGDEGVIMAHNNHIRYLYPVLLHRVFPFFIGKDARDLDALIDGVYRYRSNYKWQALPLWVCVASTEFAILELLGRRIGKPVGHLLGDIVRREIGVYRANNFRDRDAVTSAKLIKQRADAGHFKAIKFKVGGRMSNNADSLPGRSKQLIPLIRETLGDDMVIYADSNGSYDAEKGIEMGKMMQDNDIAFFEEPCPFDHLEETRKVADALDIPVAGGEQESSMRNFRWMVENNAVQVVQPDLFYFGGFVRCTRVARMAQLTDIPCILHVSGSGYGYFSMLHFASYIPNMGPYQEFKGVDRNVPFTCPTSDFELRNGLVRIPSGPGWGIHLDPDFIKRSEIVKG
ncbi:MAG: mandelate racemase/muconate lactonizing enzyme family protein [candidate division KSB1 bacterium]|nr:mandelate racemase/muconate lactonizing enzyme family protein [candidate division KSB1 bacterium]